MDKIFVFGAVTHGVTFTDRKPETKRLISNFQNGINTILISPRRYGKTSLVRKVSELINKQKKGIIVVNIDAFLCRTEQDFFKLYSTEIIKQTYSKWEEWVDITKRFLSRLSPKLNMGIDPVNDFSISFDLNTDVQSEQDILNLPQKIAEAKKKQIIICIDEFQQITEFNNALSFQKKLRSRWQLQQNVTYCLFGSKMHIMSDLFSKQSKPFYKFGDVLFLQKISEKDWVEFLVSRFTATGKSIPNEIALKICKSVENHSSYVQQLAWLVWNNTEKKANEDNLKIALKDLIDQNSPIFYGIVENLTGFQLNFIRALLDGMESEFTRSEILKKYNLGTSANISRIKKSLEQKEIIDITGKKVTLLDPVFKLWLKRELW